MVESHGVAHTQELRKAASPVWSYVMRWSISWEKVTKNQRYSSSKNGQPDVGVQLQKKKRN